MKVPVHYIELPQPPIGNKIACLQEHGFYCLERGPVTWRSLANTHMGSGSITVYDGIPDERGLFPTGQGRILFNANPAVMGMWMFDGGCLYGLTLGMEGGIVGIAPCVTITWAPDRQLKRNIVEAVTETPKVINGGKRKSA